MYFFFFCNVKLDKTKIFYEKFLLLKVNVLNNLANDFYCICIPFYDKITFNYSLFVNLRNYET